MLLLREWCQVLDGVLSALEVIEEMKIPVTKEA
jgi:hypothetical protein